MATFNLEIVTPERSFFEADIDMLVIRTTEGDIAILPDHESVVAPLAIGRVRIKQNGKFTEAFCSGGFMTVSETNFTTVVTDAAEWAHEIDVERAKSAKMRAEQRVSGNHPVGDHSDEIDKARAKTALIRAMSRLRVAGITE